MNYLQIEQKLVVGRYLSLFDMFYSNLVLFNQLLGQKCFAWMMCLIQQHYNFVEYMHHILENVWSFALSWM